METHAKFPRCGRAMVGKRGDPCERCGSRRHPSWACLQVLKEKADEEEVDVVFKQKKTIPDKIPDGLTVFDVMRPVREAVPNATVRIPKKIISSDLTCPICMNVISDTTIIAECLHRFCSDCIGQSLRLTKKECPSCRTPCPSKRQLAKDPDFDSIVIKMLQNVGEQRDAQDSKAAAFAYSDNIKVLSEDLKERLEQQEQLAAAGGRSLSAADLAADKKKGAKKRKGEASDPEEDLNTRLAPGFLSENAQIRPPSFHRLSENEYPGEASSVLKEPPECSCFYVEGTGGCKADCSNRKRRVQCDPETCPCRLNCTNLLFRGRIQSRVVKAAQRSTRLGVLNTRQRGWALKTLEDAPKGRLLEEVCGEVLTVQELQTAKRRAAATTTASNFVLALGDCSGEALYLDLTDRASLSRFVNHSSSPNCEIQVWDVFGERRAGLFALKELKKDAELSVSYAVCHVGEPGLQDHCESRGKETKPRTIPFFQHVEDVLESAKGVKQEEARLEVHKEEDASTAPAHPPSSSSPAGDASAAKAKPVVAEAAGAQGEGESKAEAPPPRRRKRWDEEGSKDGGPSAIDIPKEPGSGTGSGSGSSMNLHDVILNMPFASPTARMQNSLSSPSNQLGGAGPRGNGNWSSAGASKGSPTGSMPLPAHAAWTAPSAMPSAPPPPQPTSAEAAQFIRSDNTPMSLIEILQEFGVMTREEAQKALSYSAARGMNIGEATEHLYNIPRAVIDRALLRRKQAEEIIADRFRNGGSGDTEWRQEEARREAERSRDRSARDRDPWERRDKARVSNWGPAPAGGGAGAKTTEAERQKQAELEKELAEMKRKVQELEREKQLKGLLPKHSAPPIPSGGVLGGGVAVGSGSYLGRYGANLPGGGGSGYAGSTVSTGWGSLSTLVTSAPSSACSHRTAEQGGGVRGRGASATEGERLRGAEGAQRAAAAPLQAAAIVPPPQPPLPAAPPPPSDPPPPPPPPPPAPAPPPPPPPASDQASSAGAGGGGREKDKRERRGSGSERKDETKTLIGKLVTKQLTKKHQQRFGPKSYKDDFKHCARKLTHELQPGSGHKAALSRKCMDGAELSAVAVASVKEHVDYFFKKLQGDYVVKDRAPDRHSIQDMALSPPG